MRVDWAVLCRYVESDGGSATIVGAGIDTFGLGSIPGPLATWVALRVAGLPQELGDDHPHKFRCRVLDDQLNEIARPLEGDVVFGLSPDHREGWEQGGVIPLMIQFEVPAEGVYMLEFSLDGAMPTTTVPIIVTGMPQPDSA